MKFVNKILLLISLSQWCILASYAQANYFGNNVALTQSEVQANNLVNSAVTDIRANNYQEAATKLNQAIQINPNVGISHFDLGIAYSKLGSYKLAINELLKAIELSPDLDGAYLCLASSYQMDSNLGEAIKVYNYYLQRFPNSPNCKQISNILEGLKKEYLIQPLPSNNSNNSYLNLIDYKDRCHWNSNQMPIKVYITCQPNENNSITYYKDYYKHCLIEAFQDYEYATNGKISFDFINDVNKANIICTFTDDMSQFKDGAELGLTQIAKDINGIKYVTIKFLNYDLNTKASLTKNRLHTLFLHEIGHAIGIGGHSRDANDIMFYSINANDIIKDLTSRDINTINELYNFTPINSK